MDKEILQELREIKELLGAQKKVWTLEDFCSYTRISKAYAYHLTSTGKIKYFRPFGKKIFFDSEDVIDFLKQNATDCHKESQSKASLYLLK